MIGGQIFILDNRKFPRKKNRTSLQRIPKPDKVKDKDATPLFLVLIFAIETTEKGRYFHFDDFFLVLIIGALLPLLIVWGIIWIRSASKSQDT